MIYHNFNVKILRGNTTRVGLVAGHICILDFECDNLNFLLLMSGSPPLRGFDMMVATGNLRVLDFIYICLFAGRMQANLYHKTTAVAGVGNLWNYYGVGVHSLSPV